MHVTCNALGQLSKEEASAIDKVWQHFIADRLKGYIESGAYRKKTR